jgi:hypothetical protein
MSSFNAYKKCYGCACVKSGLEEEMENNPQYFLLLIECSTGCEWVGGDCKLTDEQEEQRTSRQHEESVTWAYSQSYRMTKST